MSDCSITPSFYTTNERKARKEHRCCECQAKIEKGEKHLYIVGRWSHGFEVFRQHFACQKACEHIRDHLMDECIPFGNLMEWWSEYRLDSIANKEHPDWIALRKLMAIVLRRNWKVERVRASNARRLNREVAKLP